MDVDEIRARVREVFDQEARIPAGERGSREVEDAYRDGMLRVVSALGLMDAVRPDRPEQHPAWCVRGPRCTSDVRAGETPEHESAPTIVPAEPGTGGDAEYRVMLTQAEGCPALVEIEAGAPDAFDETAERHPASLGQARQLSAILAELAAQGAAVRDMSATSSKRAADVRVGDLILWQGVEQTARVVMHDDAGVSIETDRSGEGNWIATFGLDDPIEVPAAACPPWCREHDTYGDGARNHASAPLAVFGFNATTGEPMAVAAWAEKRHLRGDAHVIGVLEGRPADVELSSYQLRELAVHLVAVAELVETTALPLTAPDVEKGHAS